MAENVRSQKWMKELTNLVLESEKRQDAKLESRLYDMVNELKALIINMGAIEVRV